MNKSFHGNQIGDILAILLLKTFFLTFQIDQNGTFLDNFKYDYWILHEKLVWDEIFTIFHKITHISFNIVPRILNLHTLGHPFPSAGHIYGYVAKYCGRLPFFYWYESSSPGEGANSVPITCQLLFRIGPYIYYLLRPSQISTDCSSLWPEDSLIMYAPGLGQKMVDISST